MGWGCGRLRWGGVGVGSGGLGLGGLSLVIGWVYFVCPVLLLYDSVTAVQRRYRGTILLS